MDYVARSDDEIPLSSKNIDIALAMLAVAEEDGGSAWAPPRSIGRRRRAVVLAD